MNRILPLFLLISVLSPRGAFAQGPQDSARDKSRIDVGVKLDLFATGELLKHSGSASKLRAEDDLLRSAGLSLPITVRWRNFEVLASTSVRRNAISHESGTHVLGSFRLGIQREKVSASLGVQQRMGVGSNEQNRFPKDTLELGRLVDTPYYYGRPEGLLKHLDVVGTVGFGVRNYHIGTSVGMPTRGVQKPWVGIDGSMAARNVLVFLSLRTQSAKTESSLPIVMFGIRTSLWKAGTGFPIVKKDRTKDDEVKPRYVQHWIGDTVILSINRPNVSEIVIAGDATDWNPVAMSKGRDGWWSLALCVKTVVSRVHMRTDKGDWSPIPGFPKSRDEYGGFVSLLIAGDSQGKENGRGSP